MDRISPPRRRPRRRLLPVLLLEPELLPVPELPSVLLQVLQPVLHLLPYLLLLHHIHFQTSQLLVLLLIFLGKILIHEYCLQLLHIFDLLYLPHLCYEQFLNLFLQELFYHIQLSNMDRN